MHAQVDSTADCYYFQSYSFSGMLSKLTLQAHPTENNAYHPRKAWQLVSVPHDIATDSLGIRNSTPVAMPDSM